VTRSSIELTGVSVLTQVGAVLAVRLRPRRALALLEDQAARLMRAAGAKKVIRLVASVDRSIRQSIAMEAAALTENGNGMVELLRIARLTEASATD
jgi:hypothetical protein